MEEYNFNKEKFRKENKVTVYMFMFLNIVFIIGNLLFFITGLWSGENNKLLALINLILLISIVYLFLNLRKLEKKYINIR